MNNINKLMIHLDRKGCKLRGCTIREIEKIERFFGVELPSSYKEYLYSMGKEAGDFMKGSSAFYNEIFRLKESSMQLLEENSFKPLPENTFVFWMHQGYQFAFFYTNEGNDPLVYFYHEGEEYVDFEKTEKSFTDFLKTQLIMSGLE